jgi:hypothetical protein
MSESNQPAQPAGSSGAGGRTGNQRTIARNEVRKLAENLKESANELLALLEADEISIGRLLELTRFMARSGRRVARRASEHESAPEPGNERDTPRSNGPAKGSARAAGAAPHGKAFEGRRAREPRDAEGTGAPPPTRRPARRSGST